ncbi:MAG: PQQ-binding-like beta-propeller repeat protein [Betaproteobacteria bacterium]|nr:PQQ-binding-like beta-propeller repeat protein [Betaproteobacteria bacterium]
MAFLLIAIGAFLPQSALAGFERTFRVNNQATEVNSVFPMADGTMVLSTHGSGIVNLTKFGLTGNFVSGKDVFDTNDGFVMSSSRTSGGDYLVTGVANIDAGGGNITQTGFFLKVASNLSSVLAYKFVPIVGNGDTWASGARQVGDGGILVLVKSTITSVGGVDNYFEVIKFSASAGTIIWQKSLLAGSDNTVFDIAETSAGYEIYGAFKHVDTDWNLYLGTIAKDGSAMTRQLVVGGTDWDGAYDLMVDGKRKVRNHATSIVRTDAGNLAVAAYSRSFGNNSGSSGENDGNSIILLSYPVAGDSYNWMARLDGAVDDKVFGPFGGGNLIALADGDVLIGGYTNSTGPDTPYPGAFMYRMNVTSSGVTPRWQHVYTPTASGLALGMAEAADGTLLLGGKTGASTSAGVLAQTTATGMNPVGCLSVNAGNLSISGISPSVMATTNLAMFGGTVNVVVAQTLSTSSTVTITCSADTASPTPPAITIDLQNQTIVNGQSATLSVLATGAAPLHYQWYQGPSGDTSTPVGPDAPSFSTPALSATTRYWVRVSNAHGHFDSAAATITIENVKWIHSSWPDYKEMPAYSTLGPDGTVYITTFDDVTRFGPDDWCCGTPPGFLVALNPADGTEKWHIDLGHSAPPAVAADGTVYTSIENKFYAVNPATGAMTLILTADHNLTSSPAIATDGTAYIGAGQKLLAIDPVNKVLKWQAPTDKFVVFHPSIGADGTIFVVPWAFSSRMYAFYATTGVTKWVAEIPGRFSTPPAIGESGTIYAGAGHELLAFNPAGGSVDWRFTTPVAPPGYPAIHSISSEPVVGSNGTIYFAALVDQQQGALFAIHPDGYPKWSFSAGVSWLTSPLLAADGTIYFAADKLHALDDFGREKWVKDGAGRMSPALAPDGSLYGGSHLNNSVFALATTGGGLLTAHWPAYGHDARHTSQHDDAFVCDAPTITVQPVHQRIASGATASLTVTATGDAPLSYLWYEGASGDRSLQVGTGPAFTTPALTQMKYYWVEVGNSCGADFSRTAIVSTGGLGQMKWSYLEPAFEAIATGVALGTDGTLYFGLEHAYLTALNPSGSAKWKIPLHAHLDKPDSQNFMYSTPAIGTDGTIYITSLGYYDSPAGNNNFGFLWAVNPDGSEQWRYETGDEPAGPGSVTGWVYGSPALALDGTIYVSSDDAKLHAVNPDGSMKWIFNPTQVEGWVRGIEAGAPAIGHDGTIYYAAVGETVLYNDSVRYLYAVNPGGTLKWRFLLTDANFTHNYLAPAIGADGRIYIGDGDSYVGTFFAVNADGTLAWTFNTGIYVTSSAAIDVDGTIYVAGKVYEGMDKSTLFAINPNGTEKWHYGPINGEVAISTPTIGADGLIYFSTYSHGLYALNPNGTKAWGFSYGSHPPAIASDGTLYVGTEGTGFLFAVNTSSFGLANSPWPMYDHDSRSTARAGGLPACVAPVITTQPQGLTIAPGHAATLTVEATGTELLYQWYEGYDRSTPVGALNASFSTPDLEQATRYWVRVYNVCGETNSAVATVALALACVAPPAGLVSWWPGDGSANDLRGGNNGTLQGSATFAAGNVQQAFSFAANGHVDIPYNANLTTPQVTVAAWVNPASQQGPAAIVNRRTAADTAGYTLEQLFDRSGLVLWRVFVGGAPTAVVSTAALPLQAWTHVAGTFDGTTARLYFNGVEVGSAPAAGAIDPVSAAVQIGRNMVTGEQFDGLIDEVAIFDRALSPAEIAATHNAGNLGLCKGALIDIDANGATDALTDGLMILRYLFGLTGGSITNSAIGNGATRSTPADIEAYLGQIRAPLDVDGNSQPDALTDGLLIIRYLFELRGAALIQNAVAPGAPRSTAEQIEAYIQTLR